MSKKWHKGPPPSIGWWPASVKRNMQFIRWWDGEKWSSPAMSSDTAEQAAEWAAYAASDSHLIEWRDRPKSWPARSHT